MFQSVITSPDGNGFCKIWSGEAVVNGSLLIVPADSVAFFVINGEVSEAYTPGRHVINTGLSPFFVRFRNLMTAGNPGIECQVFFINTVMENLFQDGTGDIIFLENRYKTSMDARAAYTMRFVISDPRVFLGRLIGMHNMAYDDESVKMALQSMISPRVKDSISSSISNNTVHNIQSNLTVISSQIRSALVSEMSLYGISVRALSITSINVSKESMERLVKKEEKEAAGRIDTDLEKYNLHEVYGNIDNRTRAEMLTGAVRGPAKVTVTNRNPVTGLALLPWEIAMVKTAVKHMNNNEMNSNDDPPTLPPRTKSCKACNNKIDINDTFCRYCGHRV